MYHKLKKITICDGVDIILGRVLVILPQIEADGTDNPKEPTFHTINRNDISSIFHTK